MKTLGILLCLTLAPMCTMARFSACESAGARLPQPGISGYHAYNFEVEVGNPCSSVDLACNGTVSDGNLRGRTWFIDDVKKFDGVGYDNQFLQLYNVECPEGTILHLYLQDLNTEFAGPCTAGDFVRVSADDLDEQLFCGNRSDVDMDSPLAGLGTIIANGSAQVEFCSNTNNDMNQNGFVLRASCFELDKWRLPGCTDFAETLRWDPEFITDRLDSDRQFVKPERIPRPHKRSAGRRARVEAMLKKARSKRFNSFEVIDLGRFDNVTYRDSEVTIEFENGDVRQFPFIGWLYTRDTEDLVGPRLFDFNAPVSFSGPGDIIIFGRDIADVMYTVNDLNFFLPDPRIQNIVNRIYEYLYECYVRPYPIIVDDLAGRPRVFPLPGDDSPFLNGNIRPSFGNGWIQEDIQGGVCRRVVRTDIAPAKRSKFDQNIVEFCHYFYNACDLALRTACEEVLRADPINFGK